MGRQISKRGRVVAGRRGSETVRPTAKSKVAEYNADLQTPFSRAPVDIIIPFHGQYKLVLELVESIWRGTRSNPYQICLVDDCSGNDEFISKFESHKHPEGFYENNVMPLRTEERLGFGGALRYGFERTNQTWVVFLNSDCVADDPLWMIEMGRALLELKSQNVRMVSARMDKPPEGSHPALEGTMGERGENIIMSAKDPALPFVCTMCHRELFNRVGGFVKEYPLGMYEDEEFAFRMKRHGFKQAIAGRSYITHLGGKTFEQELKINPEAPKILDENRLRCIQDLKELVKKEG